MKKFKVFFEIYGKKMTTEVEAFSKGGAEEIVRSKMIFHEVRDLNPNEPTKPKTSKDHLNDLFQKYMGKDFKPL